MLLNCCGFNAVLTGEELGFSWFFEVLTSGEMVTLPVRALMVLYIFPIFEAGITGAIASHTVHAF